jgi:hypothetical protein
LVHDLVVVAVVELVILIIVVLKELVLEADDVDDVVVELLFGDDKRELVKLLLTVEVELNDKLVVITVRFELVVLALTVVVAVESNVSVDWFVEFIFEVEFAASILDFVKLIKIKMIKGNLNIF